MEMTENTAQRARKVLIVEDHVDVANVERLLCRMEGYESRTAPDGEKAWEMIHEFEPDLILLDLMLPGEVSGSDLLERIRAEYPDPGQGPRVLVVSALVNQATTARLEESGRVATMTKPFRISALAERVDQLLSAPRV